MILPAVAATVGVREGGGLDLREALMHWLGDRRLLFVFDNVEQVIAGGPAIADLLAECPQVRILATSRQRLGIGGERILPVQPLALAPMRATGVDDIAKSAAVRLFAERASEMAPHFELNDRNATTIAALCARLDGLPLAIELAAAQLRVRTLPELVADLDRRFDLLVGGKREALSHQQSLEATIDWSYELLDPAAQRLLRFISVFSGGWSPEAADQVAAEVGSVRECMMALTEQSLIRHTVLPEDSSRWSMLESIRAFGRERLREAGEAALAQDRHVDWCLAFAEEAGATSMAANKSAGSPISIGSMTTHALLSVGLPTRPTPSASGAGDSAGSVLADPGIPQRGAALARVGSTGCGSDLIDRVTGHDRGRRARADPGRPFSGTILVHPGAGRGKDHRRSGTRIVRSSTILAQQPWSKAILTRQSVASPMVSSWRRHSAINVAGPTPWRILEQRRITAVTWSLRCNAYLECLQIWRKVGDARGIADMLLNVLLLLAPLPAEHQRARTAGEESLRLFRELGEATGEALALSGLGLIASGEGNLELAASLHAESLQLARRIEDLATEARALGNLAVIDLDRGNFDHAEDLLRRHLEAVNTLGDLDGVAFSLEAFAALYAARMDDERAARLYGAAGALRDGIALAIPPESLQRHESVAKTLPERLEDRYLDLVNRGCRRSTRLRQLPKPCDETRHLQTRIRLRSRCER